MIECEICGYFFHADEINKCPECDLELCEGCYEDHVTGCILEKYNVANYEEEIAMPHVCPKCGEKLNLENDYDMHKLVCENSACDFEMDVTEELMRLEDDDDEI